MIGKSVSQGIHFSRRALIGGAGLLIANRMAPALAAPEIKPDGLIEEPWLAQTTFDLSQDFATAASARKDFAILWEMRACPWCKVLHTVNFAREDIAAYMKENFWVVQLNLRGSRQFVDFDGETAPEEALSRKYDMRSTPTFQFFLSADSAMKRELGRVGYMKPDEFLLMMRYIREKGYETGPFESWVTNARKDS